MIPALIAVREDVKQREVKIIFQDQPDASKCRAAQSKRVFAPRRFLINGPKGRQFFQLIRQRNRHRDRGCWDIIRGTERGIMGLTCLCNFLGQACRLRIVAPHETLQIRKLIDHFRSKIGFHHFGRLLAEVRIRACHEC